MRSPTIGCGASALLLLAAIANAHKGAHEHLEALHRRHRETRLAKKANHSTEHGFELPKRGGQCPFPTDAGLVAVTPGSANAGWAMSPDQVCEPGNYCPYACPPGQVSVQWDPTATSYTYPQSMVSVPQHQPRHVLTRYRTVVYTVIRTVRFPNHSLTNRTASLLLRTSASSITVEALSHSVRQSYLATKPC